jgi:hypothetical protein
MKFFAFVHLLAQVLVHLVVTHPMTTGWLIAVYFAFATWANKRWPAPSGMSVKRVLHFIFLDWAAASAAKNAVARGLVLRIFGAEIPVPLLSLSQILQGPPAEAPPPAIAIVPPKITLPPPIRSGEDGFASVVALILTVALALGALSAGVLIAMVLPGCLPGVDGERQACTNADQVLLGAYETAGAAVRADQEHLRDQINRQEVDPEDGQKKLDEHKAFGQKAFAGLDVLKATKKTACSMIGASHSFLVATIARVLAGVGAIVSSLQQLLDSASEARTGYIEYHWAPPLSSLDTYLDDGPRELVIYPGPLNAPAPSKDNVFSMGNNCGPGGGLVVR